MTNNLPPDGDLEALVEAIAEKDPDEIRFYLALCAQQAGLSVAGVVSARTPDVDALPVAANARERAAAVSIHLANLAESRNEVQEFRREVLDGRLLSVPDARALVDSPAAAV